MELKELIERACSIAGSGYKLAPLIDATQQQISDWRHGRKKPSMAQLADLAIVAGVSPKDVLVEELLRRTAGTARGQRLQRALGKALDGPGLLPGLFGASVGALIAASGERLATMYRTWGETATKRLATILAL